MSYFVYVIYSRQADKIYIGYTNNLSRRLRQHNSNTGKYTKKQKDWILVYSEEYSEKKEAMQREKQLKSWKSRKYLLDKLKN